jgi:DNA-damage-inducible protein D
MTEKQIRQHQATFDSIRHVDDTGNEYWLARQLSKVLEYSEYRHFLPVIERARLACQTSGQSVTDHFEDILGMVTLGSGARREVEDVRLSRYACYLIVQNGDPSKPDSSIQQIASAQRKQIGKKAGK